MGSITLPSTSHTNQSVSQSIGQPSIDIWQLEGWITVGAG